MISQELKNEWKLIILNTNNTKLKIIKPIKIITECWEVHQNQVSAKNLSTKSTFMIIISSSFKKSNLLYRKPATLYVISSFMSVMWMSFCLSYRNAKCNIWTQLTFRLWREWFTSTTRTSSWVSDWSYLRWRRSSTCFLNRISPSWIRQNTWLLTPS